MEKLKLIDIKKYKDIHKGKRAFVIGMGPSLRVSDLVTLNDEITFGCNKVFLAFDEINWRPTYYSVTDRMVAKNNSEKINSLLGTTKLIASTCKQYLGGNPSNQYLNHVSRPKGDFGEEYKLKFSKDISDCTYGGYTVLYFMLQVAYYMGITEVNMIGLDFSFSYADDSVMEESCENGLLLRSKGEQNHFHPNYREKGEVWVKPYMKEQYNSFNLASEVYNADGRSIFNASRNTSLDVFERVNFDELF